METLTLLLQGFSGALTVENLMWVTMGAVMGTLVGALPGLGPTAGIAILLPFAFTMNPTSSLIMLGGIYYGAMYGGTITAVLLNLPGESDSIWTALEGHQLAKRGRGGATLVIAAVCSFFAGTVSLILLVVLAPILAEWALRFGPAEQFGMLLLGLALVSGLNATVPAKGYLMLAFGLSIGFVGMDLVTGMPRFTFGVDRLIDGIDFLPVTVGMFGLADVLANIERQMRVSANSRVRMKELLPNREEWRLSCWPSIRGTLIGFFLGTIPGTGTTVGSTTSYVVERKLSKRPEMFGKGAIEGVAGPESANNAVTSGTMVPILALGVPGSPATAVLFGAMLMQGLRPGPLLFENSPDVIWAFLASMYVGNVILLILNTFFIPVLTTLTLKAVKVLNASIIVFCIVGVFAFRNSMFDVGTMIAFGVVGYILNKLEYPTIPLVLGIVMGDLAEQTLRQSLIISDGSPLIFFHSPISAVLVVLASLAVIVPIVRSLMSRRVGDQPTDTLDNGARNYSPAAKQVDQ
ncbi:tripartite tricarboxylate transporter permease [Ensifer adhaerens]|uniref:tripartite tricarboxylate transporter permease n=1 Tax=Ensifer adhaerens TaxID=106592 RepID=UPI0023A96FB2|nr:tripartite tricarboxylate transporter permease [Ensifer adhaerens]WDZ76238.1 tripartite tricarboxylate transporter permease [Ensifer adhaerens]